MLLAMDLPKPLVWLHGEVKTPPFSRDARIEAGFLLRRLQNGEVLGLPASRVLPRVGSSCYELRVTDRDANWRILYHLAPDAVVILEVSARKRRRCRSPYPTPQDGACAS